VYPAERSLRPGTARVVASCLVGVGVFCGVLALREQGHLTGLAGLVVAGLAALTLPTASHLSGRLLLTGTIVLGWNQVIWWTQLGIDRVSVLLAALVGGAVAVAAHQLLGPRDPRRSVLPTVRWVDTLPCAVFLVGLVTVPGTFRHTRPALALADLLPGWDNVSHFGMFAMILRHGATVPDLPPPAGGGAWEGFSYPEGFHATVATLAQLTWPHDSWGSGELLVAYWSGSALVMLAGVTVLAAGLTSLPTLRERWEVAAPLVGLLVGAYVFGLGHVLVAWGFAGFVFSCSLAGCAIFIALQWTSIRQSAVLLALGGAVVGVAHGWILLLTLLVPVALTSVLPLSRARWAAPGPRWVLAVPVAGATAYAVWRAVAIVLSSPAHNVLALTGAIMPPSHWGLLGLLVALVVAFFLPAPRAAEREVLILRPRARMLLLVLPAAILVSTYIAVIQVRAHGVVTYYFWKYLCGAELVLLVVLAAVLAARVAPARRGLRRRTAGVTVLAVSLLTIGATTVGAVMGMGSAGAGHDASQRAAPSTWRALAAELVDATRDEDSDKGAGMFVVSPGPLDTMNGAQWYLALRGDWTFETQAPAEQLQGVHTTTSALADVVAQWLDDNPGSLVVPPEVRDALEVRPDPHHHLDRVVSR
jgi:hypothetical protein